MMRYLSSNALSLALALPLLAMAGCATQADLDALRDEVSEVRKIAESAEQNAAASAADARRAADEAKAASEKADRIYRESLRK